MGNWKFEILKNFKSNGYKKFLTLEVIFFRVHLRNSKKIETEPFKWLQIKDPWKSEWIRHFN